MAGSLRSPRFTHIASGCARFSSGSARRYARLCFVWPCHRDGTAAMVRTADDSEATVQPAAAQRAPSFLEPFVLVARPPSVVREAPLAGTFCVLLSTAKWRRRGVGRAAGIRRIGCVVDSRGLRGSQSVHLSLSGYSPLYSFEFISGRPSPGCVRIITFCKLLSDSQPFSIMYIHCYLQHSLALPCPHRVCEN